MNRDELMQALAVTSAVNVQARAALAAGAAFEIWPRRIPAVRLHHTYSRRLRRLQDLNRPPLGGEEAVANLAASGSEDLLIGYIDDREEGGCFFQLFLSPDLTRVVGCIGLQAPPT
ncbi:hypothetical protein ACFQ9Q_33105 [Streptomyces virginiae]|uniref:hypothetical protein n=1 Tax=Streptomyces virginiae TaxID=1961 RepID=UPI0036CD1D4B